MNDKDQAAIDHVASVSNHPHAAMIVKWLITGWDVEVNQSGEWITLDGGIKPSWSENCEYRLIEPKKPAYRVYSDPDGDLFVAERNPEGGVCQTFTEGCEWISPEWIEYDPPKKWPTPLVERIATIDIKAAEWIVDHWDDLLEDRYTRKGMYDRESNLLSHSFDWSESDIGAIFWEEISTKLGE